MRSLSHAFSSVKCVSNTSAMYIKLSIASCARVTCPFTHHVVQFANKLSTICVSNCSPCDITYERIDCELSSSHAQTAHTHTHKQYSHIHTCDCTHICAQVSWVSVNQAQLISPLTFVYMQHCSRERCLNKFVIEIAIECDHIIQHEAPLKPTSALSAMPVHECFKYSPYYHKKTESWMD